MALFTTDHVIPISLSSDSCSEDKDDGDQHSDQEALEVDSGHDSSSEKGW